MELRRSVAERPMIPAAQPPSGYTASSAATPVASRAATTTGRSPLVNPVERQEWRGGDQRDRPGPGDASGSERRPPRRLPDPAQRQRGDRGSQRKRGHQRVTAGHGDGCGRADDTDGPPHRDVDRGLEQQHQGHRETGGDEHPLPGSVKPGDRGEPAERDGRGRGSRREQGQPRTDQWNHRHQPRRAPAEDRRCTQGRAPATPRR